MFHTGIETKDMTDEQKSFVHTMQDAARNPVRALNMQMLLSMACVAFKSTRNKVATGTFVQCEMCNWSTSKPHYMYTHVMQKHLSLQHVNVCK